VNDDYYSGGFKAEQFKFYYYQKKFLTSVDAYQTTGDFASKVLTQEAKNEISSPGFETAAISAAIAMEKNTVTYNALASKN